jgi:NADH-quinone oxidoreductase subunit M
MNLDHSILSLIVFFPLAGAALLALLPDKGKTMQWGALAITLITFGLTLHLPAHFAQSQSVSFPECFTGKPCHPIRGFFHFEQNLAWIDYPAIRYHLGVDALGMWLLVLTGFLAPLGVLASWNAIGSREGERKKTFYVLFLLQQVAMLGMFVALDLFLFYAFFELTLVPMTILIATFGRTRQRRYAATKYFLYAFIPSALLLVGILWLYAKTHTFDLPQLQALAQTHQLAGSPAALWLCSLAFLFAFAVKIPIFPFHGWLKDAIAEAPTAAVMVLAGKTGLYSILRFSFGIFPEQSHRIAPLMVILGAIGIVYGALIAITRKEMKELAAYSTLSHLSFIVLGIFTFTISGLDGGIYQILNHGISGGALFLLLGFLYERYGTYDMRDLGGLAAKLPWMVTLYVITALSLVGLPMLNSFVGEFLVLSGSMQSALAGASSRWWPVLATTGVILGAGYMLLMIQRVFYGHLGPISEEVPARDLSAREHIALWPFVAVFLLMGLFSPLFLQTIDAVGVQIAGKQVSVDGSQFNAGATPQLPSKAVAAVKAPEGRLY